jgi:hypothetical protein
MTLLEPSQTTSYPDINLAVTEGLTPDGLVEQLILYFERAGNEVGINSPYAGVIDTGAKSAIMLEICRDVFGDPGDSKRWDQLVEALLSMPMPVGCLSSRTDYGPFREIRASVARLCPSRKRQ